MSANGRTGILCMMGSNRFGELSNSGQRRYESHQQILAHHQRCVIGTSSTMCHSQRRRKPLASVIAVCHCVIAVIANADACTSSVCRSCIAASLSQTTCCSMPMILSIRSCSVFPSHKVLEFNLDAVGSGPWNIHAWHLRQSIGNGSQFEVCFHGIYCPTGVAASFIGLIPSPALNYP